MYLQQTTTVVGSEILKRGITEIYNYVFNFFTNNPLANLAKSYSMNISSELLWKSISYIMEVIIELYFRTITAVLVFRSTFVHKTNNNLFT